MEGIRLWRANRQTLVGMVYLDRASSIWISRTIMSEPWSRRSSSRPGK